MIYQRQSTIPGLHTGQVVAIVGAGGVGTWTALFLVLAGVEELHIFDHDKIEAHNLNRLPFTREQIGQNKAKAVGELLTNLRPETDVHTYPFKFNPIYLTERTATILCAADTPEAKKESCEWAKENGATWFDLSCSLNHVTITPTTTEWTGGHEDGGYEGIPMWIVPVVLTGVIGALATIMPQKSIDCVKSIDQLTAITETKKPTKRGHRGLLSAMRTPRQRIGFPTETTI